MGGVCKGKDLKDRKGVAHIFVWKGFFFRVRVLEMKTLFIKLLCEDSCRVKWFTLMILKCATPVMGKYSYLHKG